MNFASVSDFRDASRRRLPRIFFDYLDSGAFSERTMEANTRDFDRMSFLPNVLVDVSRRSVKASFLGGQHEMPLMLAPAGFAGMLARQGEVQAARGAAAAGIPICLSTSSICSIEEVSEASTAAFCFQLYLCKDRGLSEDHMRRAVAAGAQALFLTIDTNIAGIRERDVRNGFKFSERPNLATLVDMACHPRWLVDMATGPRVTFGNYPASFGSNIIEQAKKLRTMVDNCMTWEAVEWVRSKWQGRLVLKGVMTPEHARRSIECGADAIVVSNHGGRQIDGGVSTISVLPSIVEAVDRKMEVLFDSGIRRGSHIAAAIAAGADACLLGRPYLYGLAADGERGVIRILDILKIELSNTIGAMGLTTIEELKQRGPQLVRWQ